MLNVHSVVHNVVGLWQKYFASRHGDALAQPTIQQTELFNNIQSSNLRIVVFSFSDLSIIHVNQGAADIFGTTSEEIKLRGASFILSCFNKEQLQFANDTAIISAKQISKTLPEAILKSYSCYANWIVNSHTGQQHRVLFRIFPIQVNERGMPQIGMYLIYDLKPFLRGGVWWFRSFSGTDQYMHYQSDDKKLLHRDMLSEREKLILEKVAEGLSSKEIGDLLYISQHTVDNHRRKMLAKTGAVDTSALIYVAKLSGILQ